MSFPLLCNVDISVSDVNITYVSLSNLKYHNFHLPIKQT